MIVVMFILRDTKYFHPLHITCTANTRYFRVYILLKSNVSIFDTGDTACPRFPLRCCFLSFGNSFPLLNWALSFRFLLIGTLIRVVVRIVSTYRRPFFSLRCFGGFSCFVLFFHYVRVDCIALGEMRY